MSKNDPLGRYIARIAKTMPADEARELLGHEARKRRQHREWLREISSRSGVTETDLLTFLYGDPYVSERHPKRMEILAAMEELEREGG